MILLKGTNMKQSVPGAQSFARSIQVLQLISDAKTLPKLRDLLDQCELTRPTLYRVLASLEAEGLIEQTAAKEFKPGIRLVSLARRALAENDVRRIARPFLERLCEETGETVHLALRSGDELVYIDKIESQQFVRMTSMVGTRIPFHSSGVGKAFLAGMPTDQANQLIDRLEMEKVTKFTTTSRTELRKSVQRIRMARYVFDDQETEEGIVCYGTAIYDHTDLPVAAVSVSVPLFRHNNPGNHYILPLLSLVKSISERLGHLSAL
jgi:IclR family transcriptional regulator, KDG regulon repressor